MFSVSKKAKWVPGEIMNQFLKSDENCKFTDSKSSLHSKHRIEKKIMPRQIIIKLHKLTETKLKSEKQWRRTRYNNIYRGSIRRITADMLLV